MVTNKKKIISYTDPDGLDITLYAVTIREDGTRNVSEGILIHCGDDEFNENDRLTGGVVGLNEPETPEEAKMLLELSSVTKYFRIDCNDYISMSNKKCGLTILIYL